jgi:hypothetical protein
MYRFLTATVVAVLTAGTLAMPTEAATRRYHDDGWHVFFSNQLSASSTLIDRTPGRTYVWVAITKKPGSPHCRTRVTFTKGNLPQSRSFEKYTVDGWRSGIWRLAGPRDSTIGVRITTNGRCIVYVGVR